MNRNFSAWIILKKGNFIILHFYMSSLSHHRVVFLYDGVVCRIIDDSPNLPNIPAIRYTCVASYCVCCLYSQDY